MSLINIALAVLFVVTGTGAFRIYQWLGEALSELVAPCRAKKVAFSVLALMVAAMLAPFLIPGSLILQVCVWLLYLVFFGVGARRIYHIGVLVSRDLKNNSSY